MSDAGSVERGARVRIPPPLAFAAWVLLGVACRYLVAAAPVPLDESIGGVAGLLIVAGGFALAASARTLFRRTGQSPAPWKPSPELIFTGPYRFTRNPMYVGLAVIQVGLGIGFNNLWISLFAAAALLTVHFTAVLPEERYLTEKFGESYRSYRARVRRYL